MSIRTTGLFRSTPPEINLMGEAAGIVRSLLQKAVAAGLAPAMVAHWGTAQEKTLRALCGASTLRPDAAPVSDSAWFDLASLTKPLVTATLTMLAFRSTALEATTTVGEVLDEVRDTALENLDIRHLLTHTSGLPAWLPLYSVADGNPRNLMARLGEIELEAAPGSRVVYSCVGFVILGLILARVSDTSLDRLFGTEVLEALDLRSELGFKPEIGYHPLASGATIPAVEGRLVRELGLDPEFIPPMAPGLPDDGNARFLDGVAGNSGLFGTAKGVSALAAEYLPGGGRLLTAEEVDAATSSHTDGLEQERGFGWQMASTTGSSAGPALCRNSFGHTGFTGVSVWVDPSTRGVFVLLTNRNHPEQREIDLHPLRRRFHVLAARTLT
jgi:CubicO group peptidase (beta-lactamase class C family)